MTAGGAQVAFAAPTELLARQHAENAARLLEPIGVRVAFLSGAVAGEPRQLLLAALAAGEIDILFGTHALFSRDVAFRRLGLVVVDEQHKFGVRQRMAMLAKGEAPDLLLMTATPIPRTLALTAFGDLDVSTIRTMPPGRLPVITHLARQANAEKVYRRVREELDRGRQAYFVYPLIGGTGAGDEPEASSGPALKDAESGVPAAARRDLPRPRGRPHPLAGARGGEAARDGRLRRGPGAGARRHERGRGGRRRGERRLHGGRARGALRPVHAAPAAGQGGPRHGAVLRVPRVRRRPDTGGHRAAEDHEGDHGRVPDRGARPRAARPGRAARRPAERVPAIPGRGPRARRRRAVLRARRGAADPRRGSRIPPPGKRADRPGARRASPRSPTRCSREGERCG